MTVAGGGGAGCGAPHSAAGITHMKGVQEGTLRGYGDVRGSAGRGRERVAAGAGGALASAASVAYALDTLERLGALAMRAGVTTPKCAQCGMCERLAAGKSAHNLWGA